MRFLAPLLVLMCAVGARAEEPAGVSCGLYAFVDNEDAGARATYDGLRKGLEFARLPRVCIEESHATPAAREAFLGRIQRERLWPLFAIGDAAAARLEEITGPRVVAVERYTVGGTPVRALPEAAGLAVVYADLAAERIKPVLDALVGKAARVQLGVSHTFQGRGPLVAWERALGLAVQDGGSADVLVHIRWGAPQAEAYAVAVKAARALRVPLVSDDRARFGQGAVVTLVPRHALLGRAAAEAARRLRLDPKAVLAPRAVPGVEVWVDLAAADAQGLQVPLPFLARADKIRRGRPSAARPSR